MSDDFLNDIDNAVDNGGSVASPEQVADATQPQQTPQLVKPNVTEQGSVADELSNMFDSASPLQQEETPPIEKDEDEVKEEPAKETKTRQPRKGQEKLLDTFLKEDSDGNLINNEGEIIALAGKSRTYYEGMKNEARKQRKAATDLAVQNMQLAQQFKKLYDEYKGISENAASPIQSIVKETGLSNTEANDAIRIMQQYKANPIAAIKNLLTQAQMNGIDISQIGANISADPALMRQQFETMLDERLAPITQKSEQDTAQQEAQQEAARFLHTFPEAEKYTKAIGEAKMRFPDMSLEEIWLRLRRELESKPQTERASTKYRKDSAKRQKAPSSKRRVTMPKRDYTTMGFDEIAASIVKDNI